MNIAALTAAREATQIAPVAERRGRWSAVMLLAAVAVAFTATGAVRSAEHGFGLDDGLRVAVIGAWVLAALVLARHRGSEPLGVILLVGAAVAGVGMLARGTLAGGRTDLAFVGCAAARGFLPAIGLHAAVTLPDGRLRSTARRNGVIAGYATGAVLAVVLWSQRPSLAIWPLVLWILVAGVAGAIASNRYYVLAPATDRLRMQWLACGVSVVAEVTLVLGAVRLFVGAPHRAGDIVLAVSLAIPAAMAVTVSRRLVARVDRLLAGIVSLAGLTAIVVSVFMVIILGLGRAPRGGERALLGLSMLASAIAAAVWLPARERLTQLANRLVYGERESPDLALRTWGSRLSRAIPMDELLLQLAESLHKVLGLRTAEVWSGSNGRLERVASVPDRGGAEVVLSAKEEPVVARAGVSGPAWMQVWLPTLLDGREDAIARVAPVTHSGKLLGLLVVERPSEREQFREDDEEALKELARQVGLALHNVQLDSALQESLDEVRRQAQELQESRARIVAAGDAERRKIERDLHDGAQQHLVALAVKVRLAKELTEDDPAEALAVLEELGEDVKETLQELRNLAHGIYPPLLMDSGIAGALSAAAGRSVLPTTLDASGLGRYPSEIEAAVYFCCLEALQNAGKHAGADATILVHVREEAGALLFDVTDTGPGFDPSARGGGGAGFVNMRDRVGAIGGTIRVDAAPGQGCRIAGSIPLTS